MATGPHPRVALKTGPADRAVHRASFPKTSGHADKGKDVKCGPGPGSNVKTKPAAAAARPKTGPAA